jgi:hypothetical protein
MSLFQDAQTILNLLFAVLFIISEILGTIPPEKFRYGSVIQVVVVGLIKIMGKFMPQTRQFVKIAEDNITPIAHV